MPRTTSRPSSASTSSRPNPPIIEILKTRNPLFAEEEYPPRLPALLALEDAHRLPRGEAMVHQGRRLPRGGARGHRRREMDSRDRAATASAARSKAGLTGASRASAPGASRCPSSTARASSRCSAKRRPRIRRPRREGRRGHLVLAHRRRTGRRSSTSRSACARAATRSTSGSIPARAGPPSRKAAGVDLSRPTSTSRAATSIAAGSSRRCSPPSPPPARRPTSGPHPRLRRRPRRQEALQVEHRLPEAGRPDLAGQAARRRCHPPLGRQPGLPGRHPVLAATSSPASPMPTARSATPCASCSATSPTSIRRRTR